MQDERKGSKLGYGKLCIRASVAPSIQQNVQSAAIKAQKSEKLRIAVLGASGYTGSEVFISCKSHSFA